MRDTQDVDVLSEEPQPGGRKALRLAVMVLVLVVIADQVTKRWALSALEPGSCGQPDNCIDLFAGIKFHLVFNTGAAFTTGSGYGPILAVLAMIMAAFLLRLATARTDRLGVVLFGAVAGGAVGNLLDRIFRADDGLFSGAVVDFIDVGWWPVFNVADIAIVVGVLAIIVLALLEGDPAKPEAPDDAVPDGSALDNAAPDGSATGDGAPDGTATGGAPDNSSPHGGLRSEADRVE